MHVLVVVYLRRGYIMKSARQRVTSTAKGVAIPMHLTAISVLIVLLLVVMGSDAVTTPTSQCAYFKYYYPDYPLLPSRVPSISSKCLAVINNPNNPKGVCTSDCQSLYSVLSQCDNPYGAARYAASKCGVFKSSFCSTLTQNDLNDLQYAVESKCSDENYCSPSCSAAIAALEQYSGCCSANYLNGPKVLCGQQTIAPCSTVLNSGSVASPTSECAYALYYGLGDLSRLPSVNAECIKRVTSSRQYCIAECQSLFALYGRCTSVQLSDYLASIRCGEFNDRNCSDALNNGANLIEEVGTACSNPTYCASSCVNAIAAAEQYGGCCFAHILNGPKVLCGQQPVAPCSTIVSSGSEAFKFNLLMGMIFMVTTALAVHF